MTLLVMSNVVSAQQSRSDEKLEFRPNWGLKVQGGASFTIGEADFSKLLSPAAQLSATYNFHHAMGVRFGFSGWEGKGTVVVTDEMYSFRFLQCLCTEVPAEDFLNFIENIGISLTRRTLRISETAGMNQEAEAHPVNMLSGSRVT